MIDIIKSRALSRSLLINTALMLAVTWFAHSASAQTSAPSQNPGNESAVEVAFSEAEPTFKDYKGVRIGMSAEEVSQKLGLPDLKEEGEEVFLISDSEMAQVIYDKEGTVNAVSLTYAGDIAAAPTALEVLGEDVPADADGRVYRRVRYPMAGYWVAYSRTAGDTPAVSVTMKRM